jgi:hypothetical protein
MAVTCIWIGQLQIQTKYELEAFSSRENDLNITAEDDHKIAGAVGPQ